MGYRFSDNMKRWANEREMLIEWALRSLVW